MGKIFCLMGKSSSGKDTIYQALLTDTTLNLKKIVPYTTRPIREGETQGTEYYFTDEAELQRLREKGSIIEERAYETFYGIWKYFTVDDSQIDLTKEDYLIIGTPQSFVSVQEYFGGDKTIPILIELDDGVRLQRALNREKMQKEPKYEEMCRRFLADAKDFSMEKLKACGELACFSNENLENCIHNIREFIQKNR